MPINFIPNDPLSQAFAPLRMIDPLPERPADRAGFRFSGVQGEGEHSVGTKEFLFWQCREAALRSIETWEALNGPLKRWQGNKKTLLLRQDAGDDLNAYYDRSSLSFFHHTSGQKTTYSGASTDVVAHEAGHAFLDAIRPQLFSVNFTETGAFHEAFGDLVAILTALMDPLTRETLLAESPDLRTANYVEATAEDLSDGIRREYGASHAASKPRRALNEFVWQHPILLPHSAPPDELSSEIHSFGRVVSGCVYDTLANIFNSRPNRDEQSLLEAAQTTGRLLIGAAKIAPSESRYFRAVGRAMILVDSELNGGANHLAIRDAFAAHNIPLGSSAMLAPVSLLAGGAPSMAGRSQKISIPKSVTADLAKRLGVASTAKFAVQSFQMAGETIAEAIHEHEVPLGGLDRRLKGVVAFAPASVLVGDVSARAAVLGGLPDVQGAADEVVQFVETLLDNDRVKYEDSNAAESGAPGRFKTHEIQSVRGKRVLTRIAFDCFGGCGRSHG
ncbi:M36 family metallopeptidase [Rosistilla oblonga]|uniref:M36 family metallopeptidase n=1 Tax=Rosistilla oblonga TaxID=2527990 RepID=UPI003A96AD73